MKFSKYSSPYSSRVALTRRPAKAARTLAFAALAAAASLPLFSFTARAANTEDDYIGGSGTALTSPGNWSLGTVPTVTNDAVFPSGLAGGTRSVTTASLTVGSLDDLSGNTISIQNSSSGSTNTTLTFGGAGNLGNGISGISTDLLFVASGATLNIFGSNGSTGTGVLGVALGQSGTFNINGTASISAIISGSGFGFTKIGAGTLSLAGANTYTGATTVNRGTLTLDFTSALAPASNIISNSSALVMGGGALGLTGKASTTNSQTFSGTTLNAGYSTIAATIGTGGTVNLALGALTHNTAGTVNFTLPATGSITTTTANTAGNILGGYATVGGTSWAVSAGNGTTAGAITALPTASYYSTTTGGTTAANYAGQDVDVTSTTGTLSGAITPNSIRFANSTANTLTLTGSNVIGSGGVLFASGASGSSSLTGGTITSGNSTGELFVTNNASVTLASGVTNNGSTKVTLVKSGTNQLTVTGVLSNTGGIYVNQGTVELNANNASLAGQIIVGPNGFIDEQSTDASNSLGLTTAGNELVVQNGGTFRLRNGTVGNAASKPLILNGLGSGNGAFSFYNTSGTFSGNVQLGSSASIAIRPNTGAAKTLTVTSGISELTTGNASNLVLNRNSDSGVVSGTIVLTGTSTYGGNTYITDNVTTTASTLLLVNLQGGTSATPNLPATTVLTLGGATPGIGGATTGSAAGAGRVSLGTGATSVTQPVAGLASAGTSTLNSIYNGATTATTASSLVINTAAGTSYTFGGVLGAGTAVTGLTNGDLLSVTKQGAGTQVLSGTNTYTGTTTVSAGTLSIVGSINGSTSVSVGSTGALTLSNTAATVLADTATLSLVSGATFNLNAAAGTSEIIGALILNGTTEADGTYTVAQLMALDGNINFSSFNGETLTIGAVPEPSTWVGGILLISMLGCSRLRQLRRLSAMPNPSGN